MIVNTRAEMHAIFERDKETVNDRTMLDNGTTTLDTSGGSVSIREMGRLDIHGTTAYPCGVDPLGPHSLFSVPLPEKAGWNFQQGGGEATLCHPQQHRRINVLDLVVYVSWRVRRP